MISYFKIFVFVLFPPAAFLMILLILPFPDFITKQIIKLCDGFLFCQPHPYIPLSLFSCVLIISLVTFIEMQMELQQVNEQYIFAKRGGNFDKSLIKLMAEERNAWISGSALGLWILLHRYCTLLKKYHKIGETEICSTKNFGAKKND